MAFRGRDWTEEEDKKLRRLVLDSFDWAAISKEFQYKRSHEACRQRWYSMLSKRPDNSNPDGREGGSGQEFAVGGGNDKMLRLRWTAAEDKMLQDLKAEFGENWECIGSKMKWRTPGACKRRWYSVLSKRLANPNPDVPVNDHNNPGGGGEGAQEIGTGNENDNTGGGGGGGGGEAQEAGTGNETGLIWTGEQDRLLSWTWEDMLRFSFEQATGNEIENTGGGGGGEAQEVGTENEKRQIKPKKDTMDLNRLLGLKTGNENDNTGGGGGGGGEAQEVGTENEEGQMWPEEDTKDLDRLLGLMPGNDNDNTGGGGGEAQEVGTENEGQMWPEEDTMDLDRLLGLTPGNENDHIGGGGGGGAQGIGAGSGNYQPGGEGAQQQGTGQGNHKRRRTS